jgi:hypothetical protein
MRGPSMWLRSASDDPDALALDLDLLGGQLLGPGDLHALGPHRLWSWATTRAVVSSSFVVIVLDFLISGVAPFTLQAGGQ